MIAPGPLGDGVDGVCERIEYDYNRQGQVTQMKDPNETVHQYQFDGLGRATEDAVTAFGAGIDQTVKRIEITYDSKRSLRTKVTQYDAATGGSVANEVEFAYNDFRQLSDEKQEHGGAVDGNTLKVSYGYEDGDEANTIRRTSTTYPNGRVLDYQLRHGRWGQRQPEPGGECFVRSASVDWAFKILLIWCAKKSCV